MTTTIATGASVVNSDFAGLGRSNKQHTPMSLATTAPAFREVVRTFSGALDPLGDHETLRVVRVVGGVSRVVFSGWFPDVPLMSLRVADDPAEMLAVVDALAVFDQIRAELSVTLKDMFAATGIRSRTFHSWKRKAPSARPRANSMGMLWRLAEAVDDLRNTLERPIAPWLHGDPARLAALKAGRFDDLVDLAANAEKRDGKSFGTALQTGIALDVDLPVVHTRKSKIAAVERNIAR